MKDRIFSPNNPVTSLRCVPGFHTPFWVSSTKKITMAKRDDDGYDLVDPIKFTIGMVKLIFSMIKMVFNFIQQLHAALTSPHWYIRLGAVILLCFIIASIGSCIYVSNL